MLDANIKQQLKTYLQMLRHPIELVASLDNSEKARDMEQLVQEIGECSDQVSVRLDGEYNLRPSFSIAKKGEEGRVRFAGLPMGHEFTSLLLGLLHVGGHPPKVEADVIEQIKDLQAPANGGHFETVISLSCHNCPDVVQAFNTIAALNPAFSHTMIDGGMFQPLVEQRKVMAVPTVFQSVQGGTSTESFGSGRMTLEEIVAKLDTGAAEKDAAKLNAKGEFDVLIIGGGPAGAAAAIYAARKGVKTGVVTEKFGGQVLDTLGIENFISVKETEGPKLVAALEQHVKEYDIDVMNLQRAKGLKKLDDGKVEVELENGAKLSSKTIILSTGARWREMNVPGEAEYRNKGVAYCPHCDGPLYKGKRVAVIGGGNSGVEAAIDLAGIVKEVTLFEFDTKLKADAVLQKKLYSLPNVKVILNALTTEVNGNGTKVYGLSYKDRATDETKQVELEGIFVQIGLLPNTDWLKGTLELSKHGEIVVDHKGHTSMEGVFAAGDCTTAPYKQIIIAMGEGANASLAAFDHLIRQ
ncbi:alkyl hydroperoxide reductase subunit F [Limnobacter parvus]|uniref:Alkyl hydroperoxide reductase subunit F n=1 Tax=Limnobacter parvus TaxID=2939690 RepID=A0ABT1XKN3_9BURK|nr:alkyl hydroperoxide reductase subunit F [Limnobacter parvus]MCR2747845.1 alkyl hydroperoxide reductase subunit F [Limnobacter parvus]